MKILLQCVASLCLTIVVFAPAVAQISITAADVSATFALGTAVTTKSDTVTKTANIGVPGATSWNFSTLNTNQIQTFTSVRPDTTPFFGFFPGSTHALRITYSGGTLYEYLKLVTDLLRPGTGVTGLFQQRTRNVPDEKLYQLPMTFGTSWTTTYAESSIVSLPPPLPPLITITNYTVINTVDAYGNLTLPGGGVHQALRLVADRRSVSTTSSNRIINYTILAPNGASVSLTAADTLQPNSGTINVSGVTWNNPVSSDVRLSDAIPADFALMQNYPNPFNPSTTIQFDLPHSSFVILVVVNVLGKEVATVVRRELPPGRYRETFNAVNLPSGVYFYKLQTSEVSIVKRMLLLR
jgi:hypothetical protein